MMRRVPAKTRPAPAETYLLDRRLRQLAEAGITPAPIPRTGLVASFDRPRAIHATPEQMRLILLQAAANGDQIAIARLALSRA